jgi:hypothetical protein
VGAMVGPSRALFVALLPCLAWTQDASEVSAKDAAEYLIRRFDVLGHGGPGTPPDGEWHFQELAQYVNASKRPPGEELNVTTSNLMYLIDTDRNSSITRTELEAFLENRRDLAGLNGKAGLARAKEREREADERLRELLKDTESSEKGVFIKASGSVESAKAARSSTGKSNAKPKRKAKGKRKK